MQRFNVLISLPDKKGLVFHISRVFFELGCNIVRQDEFVDTQSQYFFLRTQIDSLDSHLQPHTLLACLSQELGAQAHIRIQPVSKKSIVIFCTKENHCLGDLLLRYESGELCAHIKAIVSNHDILAPLAQKFGVPFAHIPALQDSQASTQQERLAHEREILAYLATLGEIDLIVLAKYMRILSPEFVEHFPHQILNIHHSFLPAFIGANPYKQAYERGVKIIGASAHFVTKDLDEGPIITQDVIPIDHTYSWQDMQRAGRDIEKSVLSRALNLALEDRIFVYQNKTIVF
ncbi:formyltetrahydrofolate deformylase [uncultured Helicobacter sp.]|uniref:formyltetrahydrofolate deformylase n=1 Tax=uncultured Helicobacter sp. TaxID=175537 RepID=UPI0037502AE9